MLFRRKQALNNTATEVDTFRYLDSVTGLMNRQFCFKEYERLRQNEKYYAVTVRLSGCEDMPYGKAVEKIRETAQIIARVCNENISRLEDGDFVIFTQSGEETADRLGFFLDATAEDERVAVCFDKLDPNESFDTFVRRIQRHIGITVGSIVMKCCKMPKNT